MLDRYLLPLLGTPHRTVARLCLSAGLGADFITLVGALVGLSAALLIALGCPGWGLLLFLGNRFLDGVDGQVARARGATPRGAFLDIVCDFLVYAAIPLAFAFADPPRNALPAAALLAGFIGTASTFLAYAATVGPRTVSPVYPNKGLYYLGGLTEGSETILFFAAMCLWPEHFAGIAWGFAAACALTAATRLYVGASNLGGHRPDSEKP